MRERSRVSKTGSVPQEAGRRTSRSGARTTGLALPAPGGAPLPFELRHRFERSLGMDLGDVRVHAGAAAATAARALDATAFTVGRDIYVGRGTLAPSSVAGERLLAHEVAHAAQHVAPQAAVWGTLPLSQRGDPAESEADRASSAMVAGVPASVSPAVGIHRQPATGPAAGPDVDAVIDTLKYLLLPVFFGDGQRFHLDLITSMLVDFDDALAAAAGAAGGAAPAPLVQAADDAASLLGASFTRVAAEIRDSALAMSNQTSLVKQDRLTAPDIPTAAEAHALQAESARLSRLSRDPAVPVSAPMRVDLGTAASGLAGAALATLQMLSVMKARDIWAMGTATQSPQLPLLATRHKNEVDNIFADAGFSKYGVSEDPAKGRIFDWCGMFVAAGMIRASGLDDNLRAGFFETRNVKDFFTYRQTANARRAPLAVWAEGQWWGLEEYHEARGSKRAWIDRVASTKLVPSNSDIRPGDVCLINHAGRTAPQHIVMVESYDAATGMLVTIEGNTSSGIRVNAQGGIDRLPDSDDIKAGGSFTAQSTLHLRDLQSTSASIPATGAATVEKGSTVVGIGRPSIVDFESLDYAVVPVPAVLKNLSPAEIRALATQKGVTDPAQKKVQKAAQGQKPNDRKSGNLLF